MIDRKKLDKLKEFILEKNINNDRIINKIYELRTNETLGKFKSDIINKLLLINKIILENTIDQDSINQEIIEVLSKIDLLSNKEIKEKILLKINFNNFQNKCINVFSKHKIDKIIIDAIKTTYNQEQLDKILFKFPYDFLKENGLILNSDKKENWVTKNSIRYINTKM